MSVAAISRRRLGCARARLCLEPGAHLRAQLEFDLRLNQRLEHLVGAPTAGLNRAQIRTDCQEELSQVLRRGVGARSQSILERLPKAFTNQAVQQGILVRKMG